MKKYTYYQFVLICFCALFVSCEQDSSYTSSNESNTNANEPVRAEVLRLEIPHLKKEGKNLFLVHRTTLYGINFCIEWDCTKKSQRWTAYQLYASNSVVNWNRNNWKNTEWKGDPFQEDKQIPTAYRTTLEQYRGSGYNRGHICPSADRLCSKDANEQTFYLSNMHPQAYEFNAGIWLDMENFIRNSLDKSSFRDTLYIVKGGTIDKDTDIIKYTAKGLLVPKYFFMAILCKNKQGYKAMAFYVEHKVRPSSTKLVNYLISVDELERKTNLDFFCNLPDQTEEYVEKNVFPGSWGLQ